MAPEFQEHPDHVEFQYNAIPGPSDEKLLKLKNYKKDPSIEPSEVIYMQIKENLLQISIMILIDNIKMIFAVNMSL